jgi:predicted transposase/invertase (TIGR01784 family)
MSLFKVQDIQVRDVRYDTTFKLLFGEDGCQLRIIDFLNSVLNTSGDDVISEVNFLDVSSLSAHNRTVHFDVKVECECVPLKGQRYIVEMQKARIPAHTNRWIYYSARELEKVGQRNFASAQGLQDGPARAKAHRDHYKLLNPIKVITILNFDVLEEELKNGSDVVVDWEIRERKSNKVASRLLSWTFVILPRYLKQLESLQSPLNFSGNKLGAWLYLMTRTDKEVVAVTDELVACEKVIAEAFKRMADLSQLETDLLESEKADEASRLSIQEEEKAASNAAGKAAGILQTRRALSMLRKKRKVEEIAVELEMPVEDVRDLESDLLDES